MSPIVLGTEYTFRLRAKNAFGWSPYSGDLVIKENGEPAQIQTPTVTLGANDVTISWGTPAANGSPITAYSIQLKDGTQAFVEAS